MTRLLTWAFVLLALTAVGTAASAKVIVYPLEGPSGSDSLEWLGEGIAESISKQVNEDIGTVNREERLRLVESLDLPPGAKLSHGSMIKVARRAPADLLIVGSYQGSEKNLRIAIRILDLKTLKFSGEIVANGPLSALPQMENELAWLVLSYTGQGKNVSRQRFQERRRKVANQAYRYYIESFGAASEAEQQRLLLKAVQGSQVFPEAHLLLGRSYFQRRDCGNSIRHLLPVRGEKKMLVEAGFMLGTCSVQQDKHLEAIQYFWPLLQSARSYSVLNNLGVAYLRKGDTALASNTLEEAAGLAPENATVRLNAAIVRHIQGNRAAAMNLVQEAAQSHPESGMLQFMLGFLLKREGKADSAAAASAKASNLGVDVDTLLQQDPTRWSRLIFVMEEFGGEN